MCQIMIKFLRGIFNCFSIATSIIVLYFIIETVQYGDIHFGIGVDILISITSVLLYCKLFGEVEDDEE